VTVFQFVYAISMLFAVVLSTAGHQAGFAGRWSFGHSARSCTHAPKGTGRIHVRRAVLGFGDRNFPAAIKTTAEWFPKRERRWPPGIFNSGATSRHPAPLTCPG